MVDARFIFGTKSKLSTWGLHFLVLRASYQRYTMANSTCSTGIVVNVVIRVLLQNGNGFPGRSTAAHSSTSSSRKRECGEEPGHTIHACFESERKWKRDASAAVAEFPEFVGWQPNKTMEIIGKRVMGMNVMHNLLLLMTCWMLYPFIRVILIAEMVGH